MFLNFILQQTLIPALDEPSVIVMDKATYHNTRTAASFFPKASTKKEDIQRWLAQRNIRYEEDALKVIIDACNVCVSLKNYLFVLLTTLISLQL